MSTPKLVALAGSARRATAVEAAGEAGATVTPIDLNDFPLPLFNQDLEDAEGLPEPAKRLKAIFRDADGFIFASPEYNSGYSALLKNTIDWCSRAESEDEPPLVALTGKSAVLFAASPSHLGGLRGLFALRELLQNLGVTVYSEMLAVRSAHEIVADGAVKDAKWAAKIATLAKDYVSFASKLAG